jgi:GNAT superfamily N-acetyltransferase
MIHFQRILGDAPSAFAGMTFSAFSGLLRGLRPESDVAAIAAVSGTEAVGLGLAQSDTDGLGGEVLSLFVQPTLWRRGLGTQLLGALEETLRERGCRRVRIAYNTGPGSAALERVLTKRGWEAPQPRMLLTQVGPELAQDQWVLDSRVPAPFEVFPWSEVTPEDRARLEAARSTIPAALWPFESDAPVEPSNSLGLRLDGEVVGWMVTHRVAPRLVRYTALYIRDPWRRTALSFGLLAEAIRRKTCALPPEVLSSMAVRSDNLAMLRVAARRLRRHARLWEERRVSSKDLAQAR